LHPSIRLAAVATAALLVLPSAARAQGTASTITGTLGALWADPRPGTGAPHRVFTLTDESGRTHDVAIDDALLGKHGGTTALVGHRVEMRVSGT
jgi:hypothetical protein